MNATKTKPNLIPKMTDYAFGKDVFLLGIDKQGSRLWLEDGKFECGWYWAFGYVEEYQNNRMPGKARDIQSHTHINSRIFIKPEHYDFDKKAFIPGEYLHHWNELPELAGSVLTESESWKFSDLMKSYYTLKAAAALYHIGGSHLSSPSLDLKNEAAEKRINEVEIPTIIAAVRAMLTPGNEDKK